MRRYYERVICPGCHRKISAYVPHRGDGSGLRLVKHKRGTAAGKEPCPLSDRMIVRDHGDWSLDV